jgi:SAM-dependent methyltransferase
MSNKSHWEDVYTRRADTEVSWFQEHAEQSLELLRHAGLANDTRVIDVGGGASRLVDDLVASGHDGVTVLDLSSSALQHASARLGARAASVRWIEGDITQVELPAAAYDIWHDRAVFHFLTEAWQRAAYVERVRHAVRPGGHVIIATFAPDGPLRCSGLPVVRYSPEGLHDEFGDDFLLVEHVEEAHVTPAGGIQHFIYCHCLKPH